jgi:hypothetical protein
MTEMNSTECEGCLDRCIYSKTHGFRAISKEAASKCPCRICIVKMMQCTGCEEYYKFRRGVKR